MGMLVRRLTGQQFFQGLRGDQAQFWHDLAIA
jgi:hypothetical protein